MIQKLNSDIIKYISSYLCKKDTVRLIYSNKYLWKVLYHIPYRNFELHWYSSYVDFKNLILHSSVIETLYLNNYDLFDKSYISLPVLKQIVIENYSEFDICILKEYPNLKVVVMKNCKVDISTLDLDRLGFSNKEITLLK